MRNLSLLTDLYQLTMGQGYFNEGRHEQLAVFDLFFRSNRLITYSVAAGFEQAAEYLKDFSFSEEDIAYLRSLGLFGEKYLAYLKALRFTGDVFSVREGEIVFPYEPILTVRAPMLQAQMVETALLTFVNHQNLQGGGRRRDGIRTAPRARRGRGDLRRTRGGHRRLRIYLQLARGEDVFHSRFGHHGAQLGDEFPE